MKLGIGCDHAALDMKLEMIAYLEELGHQVVDYGTHTKDSCDYPEYGELVGRKVVEQEVNIEKGLFDLFGEENVEII